MASAQSSARSIAVAAGALLTAAATALPAAADSHGNSNSSGSRGNSASAPGHTKSANDTTSNNSASSNTASSSQQSDGHNPPGNNGTVFIHDVADDHSPHNVPHVTCNFWVDFFNFDNSQSLTVSFAGQAPTGKDTALGGTTTTALQADDASGAGNDWDGELAFTADQLGVSNLGAPAHQGYHVKMTVTTKEPPGNHKYKVFWIQPCGTAATSSTQPTTVAGESKTKSSTTSGSTSSGATTTGATTTAGQSTSGALAPESAAQAKTSMPTEVLGEKFTRGGATPAAGATSSSLPFTGAEIGSMALAAAVAIGGGALLTVAARRRRRIN